MSAWIVESTQRERVKERGYVSPKTGTISSGGRKGGRRKAGERVVSKRDRVRCVKRVLAAVRGEAMAAGFRDGGESF